ncbi:MAG: bifunctional phosphopantothenoylcysteine decarboxylase/phosphopantothenate--cysteine ligase CoaBC [Deltaproteobacteria bacterium]|jgi:phosphopantothenoylcysteine decarboxylase/phosphopantothenate--cysteine ligase|nr:bifunctional phosphopantothenoylcysteine decarboxylase/phosphopantothenate--cysteine ligase CoaBC [Deltaproteobacteria bacterium]
MRSLLKGKEIILGVCGGIAAYKSAELLRLLIKDGAGVRVVMTRAATAFVAPMTFEALSARPVMTSLFEDAGGEIRHISWAREADAVVIAPATANIIARMAHGFADDPLTTMILAVDAPVLIAPSMNPRMYQNPVTRENLRSLKGFGFHVMEPESGPVACGDEGAGRLPAPEAICEHVRRLVLPRDLAGESFLITAGPTQEPIDPVRFLSNPSSGKMGYALARAARRRGADVVLISGPVSVDAPIDVELIRVRTAQEMKEAVLSRFDSASIVIKAAAVSDYRPVNVSDHKIKKADESLALELSRTPDILRRLGEIKGDRLLVGFAAETEDLVKNAATKLKEKNLDLIVANNVQMSDSGFGVDTNRVTLIFADARQESLSLMSKDDLADLILDRVKGIRGSK